MNSCGRTLDKRDEQDHVKYQALVNECQRNLMPYLEPQKNLKRNRLNETASQLDVKVDEQAKKKT